MRASGRRWHAADYGLVIVIAALLAFGLVMVYSASLVAAYTLYENEGDGGWLVAVFEDRASYDKNADDPRMNEKYVEYRALMEADPEWHDGDIEGM